MPCCAGGEARALGIGFLSASCADRPGCLRRFLYWDENNFRLADLILEWIEKHVEKSAEDGTYRPGATLPG
jgi:hypothetical protein